jgi:hypothetical protein|tara:strand:+ start:1087 stop:1419 length:333 start_codon:yes stop_codon:yes gene_type:complete
MTELVSMEDAIRAADFLRDQASKIGEVEAHRYHLEDFRKVQFSVLWEKAPEGSIASKDAWAYAHPEYVQFLDGLKVARASHRKYTHLVEAAKLRIEVWRTIQANERAGSV